MTTLATARPRPEVAVRAIIESDAAPFESFVAGVPLGERRFLKEDLDDPAQAFERFLRDPSARRLLAVDRTGEIVGMAGAFPGAGWSSHVAEIRVLVTAAQRGRGIGSLLARAALVEALTMGCSHVYVEVIARQDALITMFQDLGFLPEALLPDFVRDGDGCYHDLMLLTHRADEQWGPRVVLGLEGVTA